MKALTLSVIIPVYNESKYLRACLDALACQDEPPHEVIVVDNNSTDDTVGIAESYPFVRVLRDTRQGQVFAQATGFDAATGDILGRIDADTVVPADWTRQVRQAFEDASVVAITGSAYPYDLAFKRLSGKIFEFYHHYINTWVIGKTMLWGANAALRASAWPRIKGRITYEWGLWEDYDMSFYLAELGTVRYVPALRVGGRFRAAHQTIAAIARYQARGIRTVRMHVGWARGAVYALAWATMAPLALLTLVDKVVMWVQSKWSAHGATERTAIPK